MRNRIVFLLKNKGAFAPFQHQFMIDSAVKKLIALGGHQEFINYNQYNFSGLKGQIRVTKGGIRFCSTRITLVFSTSDKLFMDYFLNTLFEQEEITIGNLNLIPEEVVEDTAVSFNSPMRFLCISPIVLLPASDYEDDEGIRFVSPETDEFSDLVYESTMERMQLSKRYTEEELDSFYQFQLLPDQEYLDRMEEGSKKYARICSIYEEGQKKEIRGYTFPFTMYAPDPVQQFIYENGIGHFCNNGFGMLDLVVDSKVAVPVQRVTQNQFLYA